MNDAIQKLIFYILNLTAKNRQWCVKCGTEMFMGLGYKGYDKHRWTCPKCDTKRNN